MPVPTNITYHKQSRVLDVALDDGRSYQLPAEYLRVFSPSAEVQGHGASETKLVSGKREVGIKQIEPVGHYAVRLHFDDGHNTGLYSWSVLIDLGENQEDNWSEYLARMQDAGMSREKGSAMPLSALLKS